jgi:hypothetical protein
MKEIEEYNAKKFLKSYNILMGTNFEVVEVLSAEDEPPDVKCIDLETGDELYIEITALGNLPGDVAKEMKQIRGQIRMAGQSWGVTDFKNDTLVQLKKRLDDKLQSHYGNLPVALVIARVIPLEGKLEWDMIGQEFNEEYFKDYQGNYPKGIWVFIGEDPPEDIYQLR